MDSWEKKQPTSRSLPGQSLSPEEGNNRVASIAQGIVTSKTFDWIITGIILLQALALAIEATPVVISGYGKDDDLLELRTFRLVQGVVVVVFIIEASVTSVTQDQHMHATMLACKNGLASNNRINGRLVNPSLVASFK